MRVTAAELAEKGINLKLWLSAMQRACKGADSPILKIKGPMTLKVRGRRAFNPRAASPSTTLMNYVFMGDEKFRIGTVYCDADPVRMSSTIGISFSPVDLELAKEISGVTLPLVDALDVFDGLEDFVERTSNQPDAVTERGAIAPRPEVVFTPRDGTCERGSW